MLAEPFSKVLEKIPLSGLGVFFQKGIFEGISTLSDWENKLHLEFGTRQFKEG